MSLVLLSMLVKGDGKNEIESFYLILDVKIETSSKVITYHKSKIIRNHISP